MVSGSPAGSFAYLWITPISASVYVCIIFLLGHYTLDLGLTLLQDDLFNLIISAKTILKIKSHSEILGGRILWVEA